MKKLFQTNDVIFASLLESKLDDEEIPYIKTGDEQSVLRGTLPPNDTLITFLVDEADFEEASSLLP